MISKKLLAAWAVATIALMTLAPLASANTTCWGRRHHHRHRHHHHRHYH